MRRYRFRSPDMRKLRSFAESQMTDTVLVTRPGGVTVDPDTGLETPGGETVYEGCGKVQTSGGLAGDASGSGEGSVGGLVVQWSLYLHLPVSATGPHEKDVARIVASADPALQGRRFRLVNMQSEKTHATARRWNVQEIPEGDSK